MASGDSKVVVIGSGVGGSGCAALLAQKGFDVTVLERNSFPTPAYTPWGVATPARWGR